MSIDEQMLENLKVQLFQAQQNAFNLSQKIAQLEARIAATKMQESSFDNKQLLKG